MNYTLKELKLGGILDQGIALTRNHFGLFFKILLFIWVPAQLLGGFYLIANTPDIDPSLSQQEQILSLGELSFLIATVLIIVVSFVFVLPITNAAIVYAVACKYLGRSVTPWEAMRHGLRKFFPLVLTSILYVFVVMGGTLLLILPGILFMLWFALYSQVVILEGLNGFDALWRSRQIVRPYMGTMIVLGFLLLVINVLLSGVGALVYNEYLQHILSVVIQGGVTILSASVFVVFYFSCRCGVDNFDLEHLARHVEASGKTANDPELAAEG